MQQDFEMTSQRRKELYWWFASLFAKPLSDEELTEYDSYDVRSFLKSLHTLPPLTESVDAFQSAIDHLVKNNNPQKQLEQSFNFLFYNAQTQVASLRASAYPENELEKPDLAKALADWVERYPKASENLSDLPPDHVSVQLYLMGWLAQQAAHVDEAIARESLLNEQKNLINDYMMKWLGIFSAAIQKHDTLGFYAAASRIMMGVLKMDQDYLESV